MHSTRLGTAKRPALQIMPLDGSPAAAGEWLLSASGLCVGTSRRSDSLHGGLNAASLHPPLLSDRQRHSELN